MSHHLDDTTLTAAVAGLDLPPAAEAHLAGCVACRRSVDELRRTIAARRADLEAGAPDWEAQREAILDRLAVRGAAAPRRRRTPLLALAAALLIGMVGVAVWQLDLGPAPAGPPPDAAELERVLAEADALLADESIPGFEPIDPFGAPADGTRWSDEISTRRTPTGAS